MRRTVVTEKEGRGCVYVCGCFDEGEKKMGHRKKKWHRRVTHEALGSILFNKRSPSLPMARILEPNHIFSELAEKAPDGRFGICLIYLNFLTL